MTTHTDHPLRHYDRTCPACNALPPLPEPTPPNETGETSRTVKWMLETPAGWVGSRAKDAIPFVQHAAYQQGLKAGRDAAIEQAAMIAEAGFKPAKDCYEIADEIRSLK